MAHVLLVDDDNRVREATATLLQACGHRVTQFASGLKIETAVAELQPDLAMIDILMPGRDGIEIVIALRKQFPGLPLLVVSGGGARGNMNFLDMAATLGASATLAKPFDGETLLETIAELLGRRDAATAGAAR